MVEVTGSSPVRPTYRTSFELEFLAWRLETSLDEDLGHFKSHPARATYRTSFELEFLAWRLETSLGEDLGHFKSHPARATYRTSFELGTSWLLFVFGHVAGWLSSSGGSRTSRESAFLRTRHVLRPLRRSYRRGGSLRRQILVDPRGHRRRGSSRTLTFFDPLGSFG